MTGEALIAKLKNITPIDGADNIVQATMFGETVIISKNYIEGSLGLMFDCETLLSEKFCYENNLFRHSNLNKDPNKIGYLEDNRRIRPIKLRGVKSSALFMPIESINYISKDYPKEGMQIKEWCGEPICDKYILPTKGANKQQSKSKKNQQVLNFAENLDTDQLLRNLHKIDVGDKIIVTSKLHGCVKEDTIINTLEYGNKTIKEIVNNKINCHILTRDIINKEDIYSKIDDFYFKKNDGEWFEIELETGQKITITGNNPVWLPELNCYRKVDALKIGDTLLINE